MLELTPVMTQRVILRIVNHPYSQSKLSLIETLYGNIYDYVRATYNIELDWHKFCSYCLLENQEDLIKIQTASISSEEAEEYPYLWALRVKFRDRLNKRRSWTTHIGIRLEDEHTATLYFAELYYDHIAGAFNQIRPPITKRPVFIDNLFTSNRVLCMAGTQPLPIQAMPIDDNTIADFITFLFDTERFLPVVLIACPDLISPQELVEATKGNLAVFWLDDYSVLEELNRRLPHELNVEWDSTRVFLPFEPDTRFHPSFSASEIARVSGRQLIESMRMAYCVGMRADDRRAFVNVDTIMTLRDQRASTLARNRLASNASDLASLREDNARLKEACDKLTAQIETFTNHNHQAEITEYESLLTESMKEADTIKQGVSALSERLYSDMGKSFKPDGSEPNAQLCEL